jgi:hypothetical protein
MKPSRYFCLFLAALLVVNISFAQNQVGSVHNPADVIGPAVGSRPPQFKLRDQFDREQTLDSLRGKSGTLLVFFRSADW